MTEREARLFCASRKKFLPKRSQWELAVRGIDGRLYPWGNRRVDEWINAGLPKKVGWEGRQKLRPIREHPEAISPFGLIDTVGNAGDWVDDDQAKSDGDEPRGIGFMGGVFQFNVEDCTSYSFMRLPTEESENLPARGFWMITCRGTIPAR
jgi:formylglycine-generating enzyme required for sulfatase activity